MKTTIRKIKGTYHNGKLKLEKPLKSSKPIEVTLTYEEEVGELNVNVFSFFETQEVLKDCKNSFAKTVIEERRSAI
jgi:hypothetical protein